MTHEPDRRPRHEVRRLMGVQRALPAQAARWAALLSASLAALLLLSGPVRGQDAIQQEVPDAGQLATSLDVTFEPARVAGLPHYLVARLSSADGSVVTGVQVRVRRTVDVFGGRTLTIGQALTDLAGVARVPIAPREQVYAIIATFAGSDTHAASEASLDIVFPAEVVVRTERAPRGGLVDPQLQPLGEVMPLVVGAAFLLVWVVLLGLAFVTLLRIASHGRDPSPVSISRGADVPGRSPGPELRHQRELAADERGIHDHHS